MTLDYALKNWKSTSIGIVAGIAYLLDASYKPGMNWHDWLFAALIAGIGIVAKDATTHSTVAQVEASTNQVAASTGVPAVEVVTKPSEGVYPPHE